MDRSLNAPILVFKEMTAGWVDTDKTEQVPRYSGEFVDENDEDDNIVI